MKKLDNISWKRFLKSKLSRTKTKLKNKAKKKQTNPYMKYLKMKVK